MEIRQAIQLIEDLEYKPGWVFEGWPLESMEGAVSFRVKFPAPNSDTRYAPEYKQMVLFGVENIFHLIVADCDTEDMQDLLLDCVLRCEMHEVREFLGFRRPLTELVKPYHPHTQQGLRRWENRSLTIPRASGDVQVSLLGMGWPV